jgi:hypothetical protein
MSKKCLFAVFALFVFIGSAFVQDYFPLESGRTWLYSVKRNSSLGEEILPVMTRTIFDVSFMNGKKDFSVLLDNGEIVCLSKGNNGISAICQQAFSEVGRAIVGKQLNFLTNPVMPGFVEARLLLGPRLDEAMDEKWRKRKVTVSAEPAKETVSVPAGVFSSCLKIKTEIEQKFTQVSGAEETISVLIYDWFAPGIGWVKRVGEQTDKKELVGGNITVTYELISFSK